MHQNVPLLTANPKLVVKLLYHKGAFFKCYNKPKINKEKCQHIIACEYLCN